MFLETFLKILPLYLIICIGFIAGKVIKTDRDMIAKFLFYIITPTVIFSGVARMQNDNPLIFLLPFIVYMISCIMCLIIYKFIATFFHGHKLRNIIAFSSGSANSGHFGLPVALMILSYETVAIYIVAFLGITLFEGTYGFYMAAKGYFSAWDCIKKIFKLPALYAMVLGLLYNNLHLPLPYLLNDFFSNMRGTYIVLGISTIGLGVANIKSLAIDWKIVSITVIVKYILWPLLMLGVVMIDKHYFCFYDTEVHTALMILSIVPISVSTIVVGSVLNYPADQLTWIVLLNTLVGLIYVPAMLSILVYLL